MDKLFKYGSVLMILAVFAFAFDTQRNKIKFLENRLNSYDAKMYILENDSYDNAERVMILEGKIQYCFPD